MDKSAEDMRYYIDRGEFPDDNPVDEPIRRGSDRSRDRGRDEEPTRRTPGDSSRRNVY